MEQLQTSENLGEFPKLPIYYLAERLYFVEPPELTALRKKVIAAYKVGDAERIELAGKYHDDAVVLVDSLPYDEQNSARVGLNIAKATIQRDAGRIPEYVEDLQWVLEDVSGLLRDGQTEFGIIADIVQEAIDEEQENQRRESSS